MGNRRSLVFTELDEVLDECERLLKSGYEKNGKWSLGQMCRHVRLTIDANVDGFPSWMVVLGYPLRPLLRKFFLPRLLEGRSPAGIKTAPMFVPPKDLDDVEEVEAFRESIRRFLDHEGVYCAHPGFGQLGRDGFMQLHASHLAHHLSFLEPLKTDAND